MAMSLLCILWHSYASHLCRANSIMYVNILLTGIHLRSRPAHTRPRKLLLTTIRVSCRFLRDIPAKQLSEIALQRCKVWLIHFARGHIISARMVPLKNSDKNKKYHKDMTPSSFRLRCKWFFVAHSSSSQARHAKSLHFPNEYRPHTNSPATGWHKRPRMEEGHYLGFSRWRAINGFKS